MSSLIIGSTALKALIPTSREPKDLDTFGPNAFGGTDSFWHPSLEKWMPTTPRFANLNELYTIKVSHSYWVLKNNSWNKHMYDIVQLKKAGAKLIPEFHNDLYKIWEEKYGKKRVNFNMDKSQFFNKYVKRIYDHDSLHQSVSYYDEPLYARLLKDEQDIAVELDKIKKLSFEDQCKLFREEIYVTALERWVIPNDYKYHSLKAYHQALQLAITSLTKGWSATFIVENYETFIKPDINYVQKHKDNAHFLVTHG